MSRPRCHFHNKPGGCRKGTRCPFSHLDSSVGNDDGPHDNDTPRGHRGHASSSGGVPSGVCRFFWETGDCRRGFECRYKHEGNPATPPATGPSNSEVAIPAALAPFLSKAGLARLTESGSDVFSTITTPRNPSEVHNQLKRFLFDNYRFRHAPDIHVFLSLLTNATINNATWTAEDGQLLLTAVAKDNGLLRMNDIFIWDKVSIRAGSDRMTMSFQRGYVPLLQYLSSDFVIKSILSHLINALYTLLMEHFDNFFKNVRSCIEEAINVAKTFQENSNMSAGTRSISGSQVLGPLAVVLLQCLTRIKNATAKYPDLRTLVHELSQWIDTWVAGVSASPPTFVDPLASCPVQTREQICQHLRRKADQLVAIVDREHSKNTRPKQQDVARISGTSDEGILAALHNSYVGPGMLRPEGMRHDNDHIDIADISIAPTHEELICRIPLFLPANLYGAPHPLVANSMERILDIQFRLLREELTASLRTSVQLILDDMESKQPHTQLEKLLERGGGKYKGQSDGRDSVLFNIYTNAQFSEISPGRSGLSVGLSVDTPPGRARAPEAPKRVSFWEGMSGKRLLSGGLVALVWQRKTGTDVHLGTISSSIRDHVTSARQSAERISIRVTFFDPDVELRILQELRRPVHERDGMKVLIEATVMFASVRPFLEALRVEPTTVPFSKYIVHRPHNELCTIPIDPPAYARAPDFAFELASLFSPEAEVESMKLSVSDPESVAVAREELRKRSRLDPSQADAIVDALTRELVLIQGPPGTGKSYTGVELLRVLLANDAGPILMIAFTNHALDHMLCSVLDASITQKIVRLGSRSADERIAKFSIETAEELAGKSRLDRAFAGHHWELKQVEEEFRTLMQDCLKISVDTENILEYIEVALPIHFQDIIDPPEWINLLYKTSKTRSNGEGDWKRVGKGGRDESVEDTVYGYWLAARDLGFLEEAQLRPDANLNNSIQPQAPTTKNHFEVLVDDAGDTSDMMSVGSSDIEDMDSFDVGDVPPEEAWMFVEDDPISPQESDADLASNTGEKDAEINPDPAPSQDAPSSSLSPSSVRPSDFDDLQAFFRFFGYSSIPRVATTDRPISMLIELDGIWTMSRQERGRLHEHLVEEVRVSLQETRLQEFKRLRQKHADALNRYNEGKAAARCQLLRNVDIIGCTTTGAANLTALLKAIGPKIMLVEEAGQVLEAHVLGSLVPSIQQLILIGDPLQLRPTLNNYAISMEHNTGGVIYRFDMSLMERLATAGFPMSQIDVQRRMRPSISNLVRTTLYPKLEDHDLVKRYPQVQGLTKNVFFFNHKHKENGGEDDSITKYNQFEVDMAVDLVMYLLRQGAYSKEGDIVVLCAYLGQLARMRDAFANKVAVVIDERDRGELADREAEKDDMPGVVSEVEHVKVSKRILLRTIDNFQGEEAKIIILSLVRNSGGSEDDDAVHGHSSAIRPNVGFLKSENRTNVALSRAREGLFIFGNARDLSARSKMWRSVISNLQDENSVGDALPVACYRHSDTVQLVSKPGMLPRISPDGGCLRQCDARLGCGHLCPYKCHSDDPNHVSVNCGQRCTKLCPRGHPCSKPCADACGKCVTPTANVELPCGHTISHVPCFELDNLAEVFCNVVVRKKLPTCEHDAEMRCSDDVDKYQCAAACKGIMTCCGRDCLAQCHQCQTLNVGNDEAATPGSIARQVHCSHPCQRRLFCEHQCDKMCSNEHQCTDVCRAPCRQECPHARCRQQCSTPCAPCQEPCTWQCVHHVCPVPCGSICARLPCDIRCRNTLPCGHRCPSLCGEDCTIQVCPLCVNEEEKDTVVDLILSRTIADIDPDMETLDDLLITIPNCRHVFTVETLDGHLSMDEYYLRKGIDGPWIALQSPPFGFRRPPTCPTCRTTITSPRYGRIFKRADLDILENNVASRMSQSLSNIHSRLQSLSKTTLEDNVRTTATNPNLGVQKPIGKNVKQIQKSHAALLREMRVTPAPVKSLDPSGDLHGIPVPEARAWRSVMHGLLTCYHDVVNIASTRSAHAHAWEASFSYLYQKEIDLALQDPERAPRNPHEYAMRLARLNVGQPQPRADMRFLVEAFWTTITIRLTLANLTRLWLSVVSSRRSSYPTATRRMWEMYISLLLRACAKDGGIALNITLQSDSRRQAVKTTLLLMRIEIEQFQFNIEGARENGKFSATRLDIADRAAKKVNEATIQRKETIDSYRAQRSDDEVEVQWLTENFSQPAQAIVDEWEKIEKSLRMATFYEPVSLGEMEGIVKAFNFSHTGHFYKCPNGHTFVIADCGGATNQSSCPECGAAIGGTGHSLLATNSRAMEYEEISRVQGAAHSPWSWGV